MTFNEFKQEIKNIIIRVHGRGIIDSELAKKVINDISLRCVDVDNNDEYFLPLFEGNKSPIEAIESLRYNEDELFRTIDSFSDELLLKEIENRGLDKYVIDDAYTSDLEDELCTRWDRIMIKPNELDRDELLDLLNITENDICAKNSIKDSICHMLGYSNSFAYNKTEILNELKRVL